VFQDDDDLPLRRPTGEVLSALSLRESVIIVTEGRRKGREGLRLRSARLAMGMWCACQGEYASFGGGKSDEKYLPKCRPFIFFKGGCAIRTQTRAPELYIWCRAESRDDDWMREAFASSLVSNKGRRYRLDIRPSSSHSNIVWDLATTQMGEYFMYTPVLVYNHRSERP
jgi:hypothetical protein